MASENRMGIDGALLGQVEATAIIFNTVEQQTAVISSDGVFWRQRLSQIEQIADNTVISPDNPQLLINGVDKIYSFLEDLLNVTSVDSKQLFHQRCRFSRAVATQLQARLRQYNQEEGSPKTAQQKNQREKIQDILLKITQIIKTNKSRQIK